MNIYFSKKIRALCIVATSLLMSGYQSPAENIANQIKCTDPRPEICPMNWKPVCGYYSDQSVKTFSNACSACSDKKIVAYTENQCSKE
jgi:hypothetical protein